MTCRPYTFQAFIEGRWSDVKTFRSDMAAIHHARYVKRKHETLEPDSDVLWREVDSMDGAVQWCCQRATVVEEVTG